jgi:hypothetical protein
MGGLACHLDQGEEPFASSIHACDGRNALNNRRGPSSKADHSGRPGQARGRHVERAVREQARIKANYLRRSRIR